MGAWLRTCREGEEGGGRREGEEGGGRREEGGGRERREGGRREGEREREGGENCGQLFACLAFGVTDRSSNCFVKCCNASLGSVQLSETGGGEGEREE